MWQVKGMTSSAGINMRAGEQGSREGPETNLVSAGICARRRSAMQACRVTMPSVPAVLKPTCKCKDLDHHVCP